MATWRLLGCNLVQRKNPNVTIPPPAYDALSLADRLHAYWAIDHELEWPVLLEQHPFAASGLEPQRFATLGEFGLRGSDDRMIRLPKRLRSGAFDPNGSAPIPCRRFAPDQFRLFVERTEPADESPMIAVVTESEFRSRLERNGSDRWAETDRNYAAVFRAGLGDTVPIETRRSGESDGADASEPVFEDLAELYRVCNDADGEIRTLIRQVPSTDASEMVTRQYSSLLTGTLIEHGIEAEAFFDSLYTTAEPIAEQMADVAFRIDIDDRMEQIDFRTDRGTLTVEQPKLLWDCHCEKPVGSFESEQRPINADDFACPIHDHELGDYVSDRFTSDHAVLRFDETDVFWKNTRNLWPPSVDAFKIVEALQADGAFSADLNSIADVGCGTGFLGIALARANPSIEDVYLTDWLLTPIAVAKANWLRNVGRWDGTSPTLHLRLGLGFQFAHHRDLLERPDPVDLCICNPPYLPDLEAFQTVGINHTVGGTDLLENVIEHGLEVASTTYVHFSDIALDIAQQAADRAGVELELVDEKWEVPFRVVHALDAEDYTETLLDHGLKTRTEGRYRYWHDIGTYRIER